MKKFLIVFLTLWIGAQFAQAASATVSEWMEAEAIEMCHRDGGTPETCGDLVLD